MNCSKIVTFLSLVGFAFIPNVWAEKDVETINPNLLLNGAATMFIEAGEIYREPGFRAFDVKGVDISEDVVVKGSINTLVLGEQSLVYRVSDSFGNTVEAVRMVAVVDSTPPAISAPKNVLVPSESGNPIPVLLGVGYAEDLFDLTIRSDAPDAFPVGVTIVRWTATDTSGNSVSAKQLVTVVAGATMVQLD